jgi:hypothetical protein
MSPRRTLLLLMLPAVVSTAAVVQQQQAQQQQQQQQQQQAGQQQSAPAANAAAAAPAAPPGAPPSAAASVLTVTAVGMPIGHLITIAPGVEMPLVSNGAVVVGTDGSSSDKETQALNLWFAEGGRGVDTAWNYGNQLSVGWALNNASAALRSELFVTTKIPCVVSACAWAPAKSLYFGSHTFADTVLQVDLRLGALSCAGFESGCDELHQRRSQDIERSPGGSGADSLAWLWHAPAGAAHWVLGLSSPWSHRPE